MGLDITAYQELKLVETTQNKHGEYINNNTGLIEENIVKIHDDPHFPGQIQPLKANSTYRYARSRHCFSSSYHGYGIWRNQLAQLAGYTPIVDRGEVRYDRSAWNQDSGKFHKLINFNDNEGIIGQNAIQELLIDFKDQEIDNTNHEFNGMYYKIWDAFIFAQNDGLIKFS